MKDKWVILMGNILLTIDPFNKKTKQIPTGLGGKLSRESWL